MVKIKVKKTKLMMVVYIRMRCHNPKTNVKVNPGDFT